MANFFKVPGSNDTIDWEAEPVTRGAFTILSICIITLTLCVWSCLHLNIPGNDQSYWPKFFRRLAWIAGTIIAPEYLILTAWGQRQLAKGISKEVEETFNSKKKWTADPESQPFSRRHPWTMTHSFWAIMGGIAIDPSNSDPFIPDSKCSRLTPNGVSLLLKHEPQLLPDISEEEVKDKSKVSSLSKFVVCVQATWFCLSCIARVSQKLPISILELNTFANVLCTVIIYIIWWKKPLDIEQPLVIQEDRMRRLLAYMWMASKTSCIPKPTGLNRNNTITFGRDPEFEAIIDDKRFGAGGGGGGGSGVLNAKQEVSNSINPAVHIPNVGVSGVATPSTVTVTTTQDLPGTSFRVNVESTRWKMTSTYHNFTKDDATSVYYKPAVFNLTPRDVRRWQLAREAMDKYDLKKPDTNLDFVTIKPVAESIGLNIPDENPVIWGTLGFLLVVASYGGLHTLAWNAYFPTQLELELWRISALIVAIPAALCFLFICLAFIVAIILGVCFRYLIPNPIPKPTEKSSPNPSVVQGKPSSQSTAPSEKVTKSILRGLGVFARNLAAFAIMFLYFPARGYLVYESFRTVFFLPPEANMATMWTQYLPHII